MVGKKRQPTDSTMRNVQASNKRLAAVERRLDQLSTHVIATLKRLEQKVDTAANSLRTDAAQLTDLGDELSEVRARVQTLESDQRNDHG